ncbi:DUF3169 family protein [Streptococcus saliviloxodontae]|uniref:ABC-type antimicrobial peptide transport system permease subunit n=1 Tax=Streptococcus saliviloxodontae TaxID=1349416 RepID=A0ABS2PNA0_9STRE|nr:DUF3169 family protein [Streptococcus saliviloxodontae]MBM7636445.1 ABC-type antimicrobial peptide transport system permease subunit [Streptococcus saliviloxodontae]
MKTLGRMIKQLGIGALCGGLIGIVMGWLLAVVGPEKLSDLLLSSEVMEVFIWGLRLLYLFSIIAMLFYLQKAKKEFVQSQKVTDEVSDDLYRQSNKDASFSSIALGFSSIFVLLALILSFSITVGENGMEMAFPILDLLALLVIGTLQVLLLRFYNKMRGISMPLQPTLKELKNNVMQMDEAELEANRKMSFDIVMTLNGLLLPALYLFVFFLSVLLQRAEVTAVLVLAVIHLYIIFSNIKMTRNYYK